jgi:CheY-like chemotaxis protein
MPAILTVDDGRAVRTIIGKQVKELGFDLLEAEDGVQGLEQLAQAQVDLVLLDVTMPNMYGPTTLQKMREGGKVVLDLGTPPLECDRLPKLVLSVADQSRELGVSLAVVGPADVSKILAGYIETKDLKVFGNVREARAGAAA